jgi:hypothetical protein
MGKINQGIVNIGPRERSEIEASEVKRILSRIIGQCLFDISLGIGSFLFLEFGEKIFYSIKTNKGIHRRERGQWHFWLYQCSWTIKHNENIMVTSNDERELIAEYINSLKFSRLESITFNDLGELDITLSKGYRIFTYISNLDDVEEWMLFMSDLRVISSGPNHKFMCEHPIKSLG